MAVIGGALNSRGAAGGPRAGRPERTGTGAAADIV